MDIGPINIIEKSDSKVYQVDFTLKEQAQQLWFEVSHCPSISLTNNADSALLALLLPAMLAKEDIHIKDAVSERLLFNLNGPYQSLVLQQIPFLNRINISAERCSSQVAAGEGVISGFSAGIDSFSTICDYFAEHSPKQLKITHLLYNNVGSHGVGEERLFKERYQQLRTTANKWDLPFIMVNSNMDDFYGKVLDFQLTHTIRNAAVPLLLQNHIAHFLYSSAYSYHDVFVGPSYDMAYSDLFSLPLMSTESLQSHSVGSEYSRIEKTLKVAQSEYSYEVLDVCVKGDSANNCSHCDKCLRTLLTLDLAGKLELYKERFDLAVYYQHKQHFIAKLLISDDPLLKEIVVWAKQIGQPFAIKHYLDAYCLLLKGLPKQLLVELKKPVKKILGAVGLYQAKQYY
ncbi:hypothetical protein [Agarivorans sp.]|uniref:hypothetical protein n=1 Tax=Agarivorans sp. TaxID=1872412 RepID=UPI003D025E8D